MYETIRALIERYDRIIIHRHKHPDGDAYGSQLGLKRILQKNYPKKDIYAVGDVNSLGFLGPMDHIEDELYEGALAIVVDVAVQALVSDERYLRASERLIIDHHLNESDIPGIVLIESTHIACAELIARIFVEAGCVIDAHAATALLTGIITDSGRFLYANTQPETLEVAAHLMRQGANLSWIYDNLYTEEVNFKKLKGYFINHFEVTSHGVAYMKNDKSVKDRFGVSTFVVSRAMVNQMANMKGIDIWANFTEDDDGSILAELRSAKHSIVHLARKHGGGGHALACGCTLSSFEEVDGLLAELDAFNERNQANGHTKTA
jgi:phosphoesterase RecJ-like protein